MKITEIEVTYSETCSLPGYNNVKAGCTMRADVSNSLLAGIDLDRGMLMASARAQVQLEIDRQLIYNGKAPKYYDGQRWKLILSYRRKLVMIVPQEFAGWPGDFDESGYFVETDTERLTDSQAEELAEKVIERRGEGWRWVKVFDSDDLRDELELELAAASSQDEDDFEALVDLDEAGF